MGLIVFFAAIAVLCSTYEMIFPRGISVIDSDLRGGGGDMFVRTKMDFGSSEYLSEFPKEFGVWRMVREYDWSRFKDVLGADMMMARAYEKSGLYQPVFLVVAQSGDVSSFHPPTVCYPAMGYGIEQEGSISFDVSDIDWAEEPWLTEEEGQVFKGELDARMLVVSRRNPDGSTAERRVVLYYYVKDGWVVTDNITMVQVSALAPVNSSYEGILQSLKELMGDSLPVMFEPREVDDEVVALQVVHRYGALGWLMIVAGLMIPVTIAFFPAGKLRAYRARGNLPRD